MTSRFNKARLAEKKSASDEAKTGPTEKGAQKTVLMNELPNIFLKAQGIVSRLPGWTVTLVFQMDKGGNPHVTIRDGDGKAVAPTRIAELTAFNFGINKLQKAGLIENKSLDHVKAVLAEYGADGSTDISRLFGEVRGIETRIENMNAFMEAAADRISRTDLPSKFEKAYVTFLNSQVTKTMDALKAYLKEAVRPGQTRSVATFLKEHQVTAHFQKLVYTESPIDFNSKNTVAELAFARGLIIPLAREEDIWADFLADSGAHVLQFDPFDAMTDKEIKDLEATKSPEVIQEMKDSFPGIIAEPTITWQIKVSAGTLTTYGKAYGSALPKNYPAKQRLTNVMVGVISFLYVGRTYVHSDEVAMIKEATKMVTPAGCDFENIGDFPVIAKANMAKFIRFIADETKNVEQSDGSAVFHEAAVDKIISAWVAQNLRNATEENQETIKDAILGWLNKFEGHTIEVPKKEKKKKGEDEEPPFVFEYVRVALDTCKSDDRIKIINKKSKASKTKSFFIHREVEPYTQNLSKEAVELIGSVTMPELQLIAAEVAVFKIGAMNYRDEESSDEEDEK